MSLPRPCHFPAHEPSMVFLLITNKQNPNFSTNAVYNNLCELAYAYFLSNLITFFLLLHKYILF